MARKRSSHGKSDVKTKAAAAPGSKIKKIEKYEDTIEEGGVDDFIFKRDQIMFDNAGEDDDEDVNGEEGEEVFALDVPKRRTQQAEEGFDEEDEEEYDAAPVKKGRKEKKKIDVSGKGRFGKPVEDSDEEEEESGSSDEDDEGWGRQYYSKPSNRREKEDEDAYDEQREEDREMEEREVRRLQRKAREAFGGEEDWGLEEVPASETRIESAVEAESISAAVPAPETSDPATLIRHLEAHEPVKIALVRDFPLVVHKLQKTAKGIEEMMAEEEGQESLHKGLGWLHYQTLLTYATTLAFYIHLSALPPDSRPDLSQHPILTRLLQLKEGVGMLEDLDFAAGERSDVDPLEDGERTEEEEELAELIKSKKELMARMMIASGSGHSVPGMPGDEDDDQEDDDDEPYDEVEDMESLWHQAGLEDGELDDLLADAGADDEPAKDVAKLKKAKKSKKSQRDAAPDDEVEKKKKKKSKKAKAVEDVEPLEDLDGAVATKPAFAPLEEPAFVSAKKTKSKGRSTGADDILGDPTALDDADATDKERRKRSLQFHTSKIASTSARRTAARAQRLGGDEDLPYRDRQAARDAALRKNSQAAVGADLDGSEFSEKDKKRAREVREEDVDDGGDDDGEDYYDLVKRRKTAKDEAKAAAHDEYTASKFASFEDDSHEGGPRSVTRAIEKNRGLTPRRSKTGRNPRVKKRMAYEKAKQKVGSQRAVFKGGQATLGGSYQGEKTGISQVAKSRKF